MRRLDRLSVGVRVLVDVLERLDDSPGTDPNEQILVQSVLAENRVSKPLAVSIRIVGAHILGHQDSLVPRCQIDALLSDLLFLNDIEFNVSHYDLVCQRVLDSKRVVVVVSASENMLFIVISVQVLILFVEDLVEEANIWSYQELDQIGGVKVMVEFLGVVLIAPSLDPGEDEAFLVLDGFSNEISIRSATDGFNLLAWYQ